MWSIIISQTTTAADQAEVGSKYVTLPLGL